MRFFYMIFVLILIVILSACSDDSSKDTTTETKDNNVEKEKEESKEASSEEESDDNDKEKESESQAFSHINLLNEEPISVDSANVDVVDIGKGPKPTDYNYFAASHGIFILESNDRNRLMDYETGEGIELISDLDSHLVDKSVISSDMHSESFLFEDKYYVTLRDTDGDYPLTEVDLMTGEVEKLININPGSQMTKKDDILYVMEGDNLFAVDFDTEDKLWEVAVDDDLYGSMYATDNAILLASPYGLAAFSIEDGDILYEEDEYYYDIKVDGNTFYALIDDLSTTDKILRIVEFDDLEGKREELIEAPAIDYPYEEYRITIELINDIFYIYFESGIFAFDANNYEHLWTVSVGDNVEDRRDTDDDFNYDFYAAFGKEHIYTVTEKFSSTKEGDNFVSIIDAKTGDVLEHYSIGDGRVAGPFADQEKEQVFVYIHDFYGDDAEARVYLIPYQ